jgi:hypothetical protein
MPFFSGNTDMDALIDLIADQLIATGAWVTADASLVAGVHPAKRALQHATDTNFYVYLTRQLATPTITANYSVNEILIQLASGFNTGTHAPSGTIYTTGIPAEGPQINQNNMVASNKAGTHYTWVDASGVTVLATWASSGFQDFTCIFSLERNTAKEYADGFSNFFCISVPNANYTMGTSPNQGNYYGLSGGANTNQNHCARGYVLRPFNFQEYSDYNNALATFFGAYRSLGNSKVYFAFPFFSNSQTPLQRSLIAQTHRFFLIQPGSGLSDGDLVTYVSGPNTYTYLVKTLQSPDSANYSPWAVRQA